MEEAQTTAQYLASLDLESVEAGVRSLVGAAVSVAILFCGFRLVRRLLVAMVGRF